MKDNTPLTPEEQERVIAAAEQLEKYFRDKRAKERQETKKLMRKGAAKGIRKLLAAGAVGFGIRWGMQPENKPVVDEIKENTVGTVAHSLKETLSMFQDLMPEEKTPEQRAQDQKRIKERKEFLNEIGYKIEYVPRGSPQAREEMKALREAGLYSGTDGIEYGNLKEAAKHYSGTDVYKVNSGRKGRNR